MRISRAAATIAAAAIVSGFGITHHGAVAAPAANPASTHQAITHQAAAHLVSDTRPAADPSLAWLGSPGGQAQVTFNTDVDHLAAALQIEDHSPTTANHLAFEAAARTVRAQARTIERTPALLPEVGRAGYQKMLNDFITVANLLQPGPGYGTTPQDTAAWYTALAASNITIS
jgi:hypothetical protein